MTREKKKILSKTSRLWLSVLGGLCMAGLAGVVIARMFFPNTYYQVKDFVWRLAVYNVHYVGVGQPAPDFAIQDLDGQTVTLSQFRGQTVILTISATWCPDCKKQIPFLNRLHQTRKDLVILAMDTSEPEPLVREFAEKMGITYPVLVSETGEKDRSYRVSAYPTTFVIDPKGTIRSILIGEVTEERLAPALQGARSSK